MIKQRPLVTNAADEKQLKEADYQVRTREIDETAELIELLRVPAFRRYTWRYMAACNVFSAGFEQSGSRMAFNEGARNIGTKMLSEIMDADPESFILMMQESKKGK